MAYDIGNMTVKQIVGRWPETRGVFTLLEISCDLEVPATKLAEARYWPGDILPTVLSTAGEDQTVRLQMRIHCAVVAYVQDYYHEPLEDELAAVEELLADAVAFNNRNRDDLSHRLQSTFLRLGRQLRLHVSIEEQLLFPNLCEDSRGDFSVGEMAMREMDKEHDILKAGLVEITAMTNNYTPPGDHDEEMIALFEALKSFGIKLREHALVEHDFLWPTTVQAGETEEIGHVPVAPDDAQLQQRLCPQTNQQCEQGHPSICTRFWLCLQNAVDDRWTNADRHGQD